MIYSVVVIPSGRRSPTGIEAIERDQARDQNATAACLIDAGAFERHFLPDQSLPRNEPQARARQVCGAAKGSDDLVHPPAGLLPGHRSAAPFFIGRPGWVTSRAFERATTG